MRKVLIIFFMMLLLTGCGHKKKPLGAISPSEIKPVKELYETGIGFLNKGKNTKCRTYLDQVVLREDSGEYKDLATIAIADSYFQEENVDGYAEAISRYRTFLAFKPAHEKADYCQFRIGESYFKQIAKSDRDQSMAQKAEEEFKKLIENYPNSPYVGEAKKRIEVIEEKLVAHDLTIGDYYFRQGDFSAATSRYEWVLDHYPDYWNRDLIEFKVGEAYFSATNYEKASIFFKQVIESNKNDKLAGKAHDYMNKIEKIKSGALKEKKIDEPTVGQVEKKGKKPWWKFWKRG